VARETPKEICSPSAAAGTGAPLLTAREAVRTAGGLVALTKAVSAPAEVEPLMLVLLVDQTVC
jgi:hypothetical protein